MWKTIIIPGAPLLPLALLAWQAAAQSDPLPSWADGDARKSIMRFVGRVIKQGSPDFVPPMERIAVFDNDGTLWAEQPVPFQGLFATDRVHSPVPPHPYWKEKQPFKAVLEKEVSLWHSKSTNPGQRLAE